MYTALLVDMHATDASKCTHHCRRRAIVLESWCSRAQRNARRWRWRTAAQRTSSKKGKERRSQEPAEFSTINFLTPYHQGRPDTKHFIPPARARTARDSSHVCSAVPASPQQISLYLALVRVTTLFWSVRVGRETREEARQHTPRSADNIYLRRNKRDPSGPRRQQQVRREERCFGHRRSAG